MSKEKTTISYYFIFLVFFLMLNEIFDTYTTLFWNSIGSFVQLEFQISESEYALGIGLASIGMFLVFFVQFISDKIGRKIVLFIVLFGLGFIPFCLNFVTTFPEFVFLLFLLFIWFSSDIWTIMVSEECPPKHRSKILNLILIVGASASIIIPIFRSLLIPTYGWRSMTWFAALAIPASLLIIFVRETRAYKNHRIENHSNIGQINRKNTDNSWLTQIQLPFKENRHLNFIALMVSGFLIGINYSFLSFGETYLTLDRSLDHDYVSFVIFVMGVAAIIGYAISGFLNDLIGRKSTFYLFASFFPLGIFLVIFGDQIMIIIGSIILSASFWSINIINRLMCIEHYPTKIRGTSNGYRSLFYSLGIVIGSFITSLLIPVLGLGLTFLALSLTLLPTILLVKLFLTETNGIALQ